MKKVFLAFAVVAAFAACNDSNGTESAEKKSDTTAVTPADTTKKADAPADTANKAAMTTAPADTAKKAAAPADTAKKAK
jgi:uncharacterized lipoprotein